MKILSIVLPVYNEQETLPLLRRRLTDVAEALRQEKALAVEIVLVDDGSRDLTPNILESWAQADPAVTVLRLSRNFGHQAAITAGLDAARGDTVIMMDADLQDPPEVIPRLVERCLDGNLVVYARRTTRKGETVFKRLSAWLFYRLMRRLVDRELPQDVGDFRLVSGAALASLRRMRERHRFIRGLSTWIGFRQAEVLYRRPARAAGETKFSTLKMLGFAWNAAVSFSTLPLRLVALWGTAVSLFGIAYLGYTLYHYFVYRDTVPGWATLIVLLCLIGGSILVSLGILGSYVGKIFEEVKGRPLYIVDSVLTRSRPGGSSAAGTEESHRADRGAREDVPQRVGVEYQA